MEWKPWARRRKATRKGKFVVSLSPLSDRGNEGDEERCTEPRGVALQPAWFAYLCRASFACHLHHHLTSACSFCVCPVPQRPPSPLPFRSRCTVAFGLCIIITITASSSWLVVEKPPRILLLSYLSCFSSQLLSLFPPPSFSISLSLFECQETRDEKEREVGRLTFACVC